VGDYFPVQSGPVTTIERPHRLNNSLAGSQPQPTAGTIASPPAVVGPNTALLAARQLLNNPPPARASPSAAEQWHHDVDQLVITAINTPHRDGRRQPSAQQSRFPSAAQHHASMASYQTSDLREEINHRCGGEDSHTTIERNHERRRDIEGRTSRETSTCMHQWVRAKSHMHLSP
jgi:hypothetical protein